MNTGIWVICTIPPYMSYINPGVDEQFFESVTGRRQWEAVGPTITVIMASVGRAGDSRGRIVRETGTTT